MTGTSGTALDRLAGDPRYRDLVRRRSTLGWVLAGIMVAVYVCFILLVAFAKTWLAQPLAGGATSIGIPIGLGVIIVAIVQTALYVRQANRVFDHAMAALLRDHGLSRERQS